MNGSDGFASVSRQDFRRVFQPSRVVLAVIPVPGSSRPNVITVCFDMYCSYKPPMMSFAVQHGSYSFDLLQVAQECVLAVPGEKLAEQTLLCGVRSGRELDKIAACGFDLLTSERVGVPGIRQCIANVEMGIRQKVATGDHLLVVGEVLRFAVDPSNGERCLLSVGPSHAGYTVLARQGIHRIGVVDAAERADTGTTTE